MATAYHNLSEYDFNSVPNAEGMKFGIVVSEWNFNITGALLKGAVDTLKKHGAKDENNKRQKGIDKAEFALQLLYNKDPQNIVPPSYIAEALQWLEDSLIQREDGDFASEGEA